MSTPVDAGPRERSPETGEAPDFEFDPYDSDGVRAALTTFISGKSEGEARIGELTRYTVGFSWITYGFRASWTRDGKAEERDLILRIGPPNGIFAPYRASPEFHTLRSLADTAVPVPGVHWFSDDTDVFGAPFFICDRVEGEAPIPWTPSGEPAFDEDERLALGGQFAGALAALHMFDWERTSVADIGGTRDPTRTALSEVEFWTARMGQWSEHRYPILEWAANWFQVHAPRARRVRIVHGDFRIGNFLTLDGRITAILDWELVHLGDPMEDLGWMCLKAWRGRSPYMCHLLTRDELCERYERAAGITVDRSELAYWEAFGTFKLAVMHLGAAYCFEARGFNDMRMAGMGAQIPRMLLQVERALEEAS